MEKPDNKRLMSEAVRILKGANFNDRKIKALIQAYLLLDQMEIDISNTEDKTEIEKEEK